MEALLTRLGDLLGKNWKTASGLLIAGLGLALMGADSMAENLHHDLIPAAWNAYLDKAVLLGLAWAGFGQFHKATREE